MFSSRTCGRRRRPSARLPEPLDREGAWLCRVGKQSASALSGVRPRAWLYGTVRLDAGRAATTISDVRVLVTGGGRVHRHPLRQAPRRGRRGRRRARQAHLLRATGEPRRRRRRAPRRRHRRRRGGRRGRRGLRRDRQLRRGDARRPLDPRRHRLRPHRVLRDAGAARGGARARGARFVQVSTDEVYGDLEAGGSSRETDPVQPVEPVQRRQGGRRPAHPRLRAHVRRQRVDHARLEHLRPEPVSGEARSRCSSRTRSTASRCRSTATAARSATGSTSRTTARASSSCCARARPARSTTSAAANERENIEIARRDPRADRRRPVARPPRRPTAPDTTAATRSTPPSCAALGWAPRASLRATGSRRRSTGTATTAPGGSRSSRASTASTTSRQYAAPRRL